jgi:hypothetical protein
MISASGNCILQKPGPKPSSVRLKLYLLPPGSKLPSLTKKDPIIQIHQDQGYGMYNMLLLGTCSQKN